MTQPYYNVMCVMKGVVIMTYGPIAQQYMMPHTNAGIRSYIAGYNYHVMDTHKLESYLVSVGYDRE